MSWRHFVYGSAHLARAHARDSLRTAGAARVAQAPASEAKPWFRTMRSAAGWRD